MRETNIFKVLADSQRRAILMMLRNERLNAGEIAEKLQITPAALSDVYKRQPLRWAFQFVEKVCF